GLQWARHVSEGWMSLWDLAKPVIAMIHGYAMAGGLEHAGACDLAYAAASARLSHPVLRFAGLPDFAWFPALLSARHAMELHVAGRENPGSEAAAAGLVNQAFADDELEARVFEIARRITEVPPAVVTVNKRFVYAALEARGARTVIRIGADLQAGPHLAALGGDVAGLMQAVKATRKPGGSRHAPARSRTSPPPRSRSTCATRSPRSTTGSRSTARTCRRADPPRAARPAAHSSCATTTA